MYMHQSPWQLSVKVTNARTVIGHLKTEIVAFPWLADETLSKTGTGACNVKGE